MAERDTFGHYRIERRGDGSFWELGRGAMAVTWKAEDVNLHCPVALKVINASCFEDPERCRHFMKEARAAALLRHHNVAAVFHLGIEENHFYYAMEYVDGQTAEAFVKEAGPLSTGLALDIALQIARALGAADRHGLVHRDIKPANILLARSLAGDGEGLTVKVIDFGLVRTGIGSDKSCPGAGFHGTAQYSSPEQIEERALDSRSDIYSLGCTLWFLLTGEPPFTGSLANVFAHQLHTQPAWSTLKGVPKSVVQLLARMLEKNPEKRVANPVQLRRELEQCRDRLAPRHAAAKAPALLPVAGAWPPSNAGHRWTKVALGVITGLVIMTAVVLQLPSRKKALAQADQAVASAPERRHAGAVPLPEPVAEGPLDSESPEGVEEVPDPSRIAQADAALDPAVFADDAPPIEEIAPQLSDNSGHGNPEPDTGTPSPEPFSLRKDGPTIANNTPAAPESPAAGYSTAETPPPVVRKAPPQPAVPGPLGTKDAFKTIETQVQNFVASYLVAAEQNAPEREISHFADKVEYFKHGAVDRAFIAADQRDFYKRWPARDFTLVDKPQVIEIGPSEIVVKFRVRYNVRNSGGKASGQIENQIRLKRDKSSFRITAIDEKRTSI